jgi:glycosyltransferase involved in cell wall biosynthesis
MSPSGRSPRVLYCTDTYPPQVNGVSVVTALSIAGLIKRGWECQVIAPTYPTAPRVGVRAPRSDGLFGIPSLAFPPYPDIRLAAPAYGRVEDIVRRFQPDLIHSATEFMIGRLGQIAAQRARVPSLSSYHTDFSRYTEAYGVPWLRQTVSRYIGRFHRRSARVYTPSEQARDDLAGIGVDRVEVWGCGVDTAAFSPAHRSQRVRAAYGVSETELLFVHVGRLAAEKGVDRILRGFARASALFPSGFMRLVIAGAGPEEESLRAGAPANVTFLGVLDRDTTLPSLYASSDAFLFSSLTETLGLVVLEAMASGLPVIATPAGGVAAHLRHGRNGLAFAPNDSDGMAGSIISLALDADLRRRLSEGARQTAEVLTWEAELDRLDASYRAVLAEAGQPGDWAAGQRSYADRVAFGD